MTLTRKASALSLISIMLVAGAVFLGNQRQAYAEEASLGEEIVCDVFTQLGSIPLPPGSVPCESGSGGVVIPPPPQLQCADGIDNDGDGLIDFVPVLGDPGCSDIYDNSESSNSCPGQHWNGSQCEPNEEETDVCPNMDGVQGTVPEGYVLTGGECSPVTLPVDRCPNIDGVQETIPDGKEIVDGNCVAITSGGGGYAQSTYGGG